MHLHNVSLSEALDRWYQILEKAGTLSPRGVETVPLNQAWDRITAQPIWARVSSPHYHASAMDGFAVRAEETQKATKSSPVHLHIGAQAIPVDTGDPLPTQMNAVIMIEHTRRVTDEAGEGIEITVPTTPWRHVRAVGEDMVATELVLPARHRLRPQDLGAIAGSGHTHVQVYRRPRVAILPTGTELVLPGSELKPGDIIEYNSIMLGAQVEEAGCVATRLPIVVDRYAAIKQAVNKAIKDHDLVLINAGSSAGSEDYTATIVEDLGTLCVHGIAIRPGHPVVLGCAKGKAVVGIPGYPVSAAMTFDLIVKPLLHRWQGIESPQRPAIQATLNRDVRSPQGTDEFLRVTLGKVGENVIATPLTGGAGVIMSLVKADGLVTIPRGANGLKAGTDVQIELLYPRPIIDQTIVMAGSHDLTLDLLRAQLSRCHLERRLSVAHVGSLNGLVALQQGEAHLSGVHLLDAESGAYNTTHIKQMLTPFGIRVVLLGFVNREQGFIIAKGNPKQIHGLADLIRDDIVFINRQSGSGTRTRLDIDLRKHNLHPSGITGYNRCEETHLAVAATVQSGAADCGVGILGAARALDLDFVPLFSERYDLVIPLEFYENELLSPLLNILQNKNVEFIHQVEALGGYTTEQMGKVLAEI